MNAPKNDSADAAQKPPAGQSLAIRALGDLPKKPLAELSETIRNRGPLIDTSSFTAMPHLVTKILEILIF